MLKKSKFLVFLLTLAIVASAVLPVFAADVDAGSDAATLQAAIDSAAIGDTVKLSGDIDVGNATIVIAADDDIVLDLNGYTISGQADTSTHAMIKNLGKLVITGNGVITYKFVGTPDDTYGTGNYTITNGGTLVIESGVVEQTTEAMSHCAITIDNNSTSNSVSLIVNGGKIISANYRAIRQFANSTSKSNDVVINGGEIGGQVWSQSPNGNANLASLTVNGGVFTPKGNDSSSIYVTNVSTVIPLEVTGGHFNGKIGTDNPTALAGAITGGTFSEEALNATASDLIDDGVVGNLVDGVYTMAPSDPDAQTDVVYQGLGVEEYEITVPARLAPGESGLVKVEGTWAGNTLLEVSAPDKVTLNHNISLADSKVLDVEFAGIAKMGDYQVGVSDETDISVGEIKNALFGTWSGTIYYTVSMSTAN